MKKLWKLLPIIPALLMMGCSNVLLEKVQSGQSDLYCIFSDGERKVPSEMVVDYYQDLGTWKFTNGEAKACRLVNAE